MSNTSNQPMWPMRKIFPLRCAWPGASVTPWRSRRCASSSSPSMPSGARIAVTTAARVVVGREELEPHRLDARARRAAEPDVALERGVETVVEQQAERDVEAADQRDRRRERRVELVLRLLRRASSRSRSCATSSPARARAPGRRPSRARAAPSAPSASRRRRRRSPTRRSRAAPRRATRSRRRPSGRLSPTASLIARTSETTPVDVSDCWQKTTLAPESPDGGADLVRVGRSPHS